MNNDIAPWNTQPTKVVAPDDWDWKDLLVAQLAVAADRDARQLAEEEQRAIDAENEEFIAAYRYAARIGLLEFNIEFIKMLYWNWRYGLDPDDAFR